MMLKYCCWRIECEMLNIMVSKAQMHNETRYLYESRKRSVELNKG